MLYESLKYYCGLEKPGYAVMVTGDWGVGKTHQVRAALARIENERPHRDANLNYNSAYVSLFGLADANEIDVAVARCFSPVAHVAQAGFKIIGDTGNNMKGAWAVIGPVKALSLKIIRNQINQAANKTIVFDDLERSPLDQKVLMGVINSYVEHHGYRVILICHNGALEASCSEGKEKIVGQSIKALPQTMDAWASFLRDLPNDIGREFVTKHQDLLLKVFAETQVNSLRILRHVMFDCARFAEAMTQDQRDNDYGCAKVIAWFAGVNAFVRHGDMVETDFEDIILGRYYWRKAFVATSKERELTENQNKIYNLNDQVPSCDLTMPPLVTRNGAADYNAVRDIQRSMIFDGHYDRLLIQSVLATATNFQLQADREPWQKLWYHSEHSDEERADALIKLNSQLAAFEITDFIDLMHIAGIRISFLNSGILRAGDTHKCEAEFLAYVDALRVKGSISEKYGHLSSPPRIDYGLGGLGLTGGDDPAIFQSVKKIADAYWQVSRSKLRGLGRTQIAKLSDWIRGDIEQIVRLGRDDIFKQPLLEKTDAQPVAEAFLESEPKAWHTFSAYQGKRYDNATDVLLGEKDFLLELYAILDAERLRLLVSAELTDRFKADRINGFLMWSTFQELLAARPAPAAVRATKRGKQKPLTAVNDKT
jgi:hypothetical protein